MEEKTPWSRGMFKIGDRVKWTSQAGGQTVEKFGEVVEVVEACRMPKEAPKGSGMMRDHESYVVRGSKETDRKRTAIYWPLVRNLRHAYSVFNEMALREEIVRIWGPAGAHVEVYDMLLKKTVPAINEQAMWTVAKKWEAVVHQELRVATAGGDRVAIQVAEWGVKLVSSILNGQAPGEEPKTWSGHTGEAG